MDGYSHELVAMVALATLDSKERSILSARWAGIEAGSTLSDHFRTMWGIVEAGESKRHLIHRCFVDSENPKDHGCVTQAHDYATGSLGFIEKYMEGELREAYETEESFLENLGMFLGVVSHHIADLCTPVHVGHRMNHRRAGVSSAARFHRKFERDMGKLARGATIVLAQPQKVALDVEYFWTIARTTYTGLFLRLEDIYASNDEDGLLEVTSAALTSAVQHTAKVWHTILTESGMCNREWSIDPLI